LKKLSAARLGVGFAPCTPQWFLLKSFRIATFLSLFRLTFWCRFSCGGPIANTWRVRLKQIENFYFAKSSLWKWTPQILLDMKLQQIILKPEFKSEFWNPKNLQICRNNKLGQKVCFNILSELINLNRRHIQKQNVISQLE